jgi:hypothetical protein
MDEAYEIKQLILHVIRASHLNALEPGVFTHANSVGKFHRQKIEAIGAQDFTSLSLFCDDVDALLLDLYGDVDCDALRRVSCSVVHIVHLFTKYVRKDLWQEHRDAVDFDCMFGIAIILSDCGDDVYGISDSDWLRAKTDLVRRVGEVRDNPSSFGVYTVEFAKRFSQNWRNRLRSEPGKYLRAT